MPLFDFKCEDCGFVMEHYIYVASATKSCPKCSSSNYNKLPSMFAVDVTYADTNEHFEKNINPSVKETYAKIGKEALDGDTKTLDNYFGSGKVKDTLTYES